MTQFFVTATGTDIGKTFVSAGLIRHLRTHGKPAAAFKPIVSGFDIATAAVSDPGVLLEAMGELITPEALARVSPWRFAAPLSPDMAAAREGRAIEYEELLAACRNAMKQSSPLFIEGVGGVMVPLDAHHTVRDWIAALRLPAILVAGSYLGTISHTLTALDALAARKIAVAAIVLNDTGNAPVPLAETASSMVRFAPSIPIVTITRVKTPIQAASDFAALWEIIA